MSQPDVHPADARNAKGGAAFDPAAGVTVRDYFAANAPQPPAWVFAEPGADGWTMDAYAARLAEWNFAYASNMMLARAAEAQA